ncbi:cell envelope biogenesis protein OmpA [Bacteroidia bacterium]|nr:cell envelope biogenesis protein OmpA [Bacteroidia bacterium]
MKKILSFMLAALVVAPLWAQVTTGSISGVVHDSKDEPLAGTVITATHTPTGTRYYATADAKGYYSIPNMRVGGPYSVSANMMGFGKKEYTDIQLGLADNFVQNISLAEESIALESVEVTAKGFSSNMRSDRAGAITSLNTKQINDIPTITRSVNDVLKLTPQAFVSNEGIQIGGGNYRQSFVTVDGAAFNNAFGIGQNLPAGGSPISLDALEQIAVSVTPYDVRQSGFIGGSINAVTRSGDNEFRGSVYTFYSNEKFRGKKVGNTQLTISDATEKTYGLRLGGPIIKNKLFFFVSGEMIQNVTPGPTAMPSTNSKPYTDGKDNIARPTESTLNALSGFLKSEYGYDPGATGGYSSEAPGYKLLARLDWNINDNHKVNLRYSNTLAKSPIAPSTSTSGLSDRNIFNSATRTGMNAIYFQNARYFQETNFSSWAGELNSRFLEGKLSNVLRASYSHQNEPRSTQGGNFPFVDILVKDNSSTMVPYTSFGTELFSYGNLRDVSTFNITDEASMILGDHSLLAGIQFETNNTKNGFQRFGAGYYQFSFEDENELMTAINNKTVFANPHQFAITHSNKNDFSQAYPSFDFRQLSFYLQDEWKLSNQFKLLGGIRFELPSYPKLDTYNEQVANTELAPHNGNNGHYSTAQLPKSALMFSPRAGFNWDITGDRKYVLRGGTGLFTGRIPFVWIVSQVGDAGVLQTTYNVQEGEAKVLPTFSKDRLAMLNQIYPSGFVGGTIPNITSASLMADDLKMPQAWKSSLALDAVLPGDILATLEGVYNRDIHPVTISNVGLKDPATTAVPNYNDNRLYYGARYDNTLRDAYLLHNVKTDGYYYSITAKLQKNNWYGLSAMLAYTFSQSKSLNDGWGDQLYSGYQNSATVNGQNAKELGYAGYVMPHRWVASLSYRKEYAKHFATSVSLFYEGGPQGRLSYIYTSNVVSDNALGNLIYVPKSKDELEFADYTYKDADGNNQTYTAADQAEDFWNFVNNDDYLKNRKGKYAERNGRVYPWSNQLDIKITQDFYIDVAGKRNTLQVGLDILNVGNLLNANWGHKYYYNANAILKQTNTLSQGGTDKPIYNFQRNGTEKLTTAFRDNNALASTYYIQLSLRYIFN